MHKIVQPSPLLISEYFHHPKRNPMPNISHSTSLPSPSPWTPLTYFLFLLIFLFWTFHINGIIQHVVFSDQLLSLPVMFSRFIHAVAYMSISFLLWLNNIPLYDMLYFSSIHHLMDIEVVSTLGLL